MTTLFRGLTGFLLATSLATAACSGSGSSSALPTAPSTTPTTETLTGTVPVGGSDTKPFTIALSNGQVNITLTAAGPPSTIFMGVGIGVLSGDTCSLLTGGSLVTQAGTTPQLSGTAAAGAYCVAVFDVGNQTADITYSVVVTHY